MKADGETALGAVLAGGAGTRLGGAKACAEFAGRPLVAYPLAAFEEAGIATAVVCKRDTPLPSELAAEVVREPDEPRHPLAGIVAALEHAARPVVVCACDMPFVPAALLSRLASLSAPVAVAATEGRLHPLLGRYELSALTVLRAALQAGESATRALECLSPHLLSEPELGAFGEPARIAFNVNEPADLERAAGLIRG